jgi:uncharacterized repeat protein (TIGR03803 family)
MNPAAFAFIKARFRAHPICLRLLLLPILFGGAVSIHAAGTNLTIQVLTEFHLYPDPGPRKPLGRLVQGTNGDFYGTTSEGGTSEDGTVFKITSGGNVTTLFSFGGTNGANPVYGGLMRASDGSFYGNTYVGGLSEAGTIFKITHDGVFSNLFSFRNTNGSFPNGWLAQAADGNFYGTTVGGGTNNLGTIYRMTPGGALSSVFFFNGTNGANPYAGLAGGGDGNFYGTTLNGGSNDLGTVFKISTNGAFKLLISFTGTNGSYPGSAPRAALALGSDGQLHGTTEYGGPADAGTVFRVTTNGDFSSLFSFDGTNGADPEAALVEAPDAKFYGTTYTGSTNSITTNGTIFRITSGGVFETVAVFDYTNGPGPVGSLALASDGNFYGTTVYGGYDGVGVVFRLVPFPVITGITATSGSATITWTSFTNGIYRVEYKTGLAVAGWTPLAPDVTATGAMTSKTDNPAGPERYYRVTLLP